jgi:hypothetical protein
MKKQEIEKEFRNRIEELESGVKKPYDFIRVENCSKFFEREPRPQEYLVSNFLPKLSVGLIAGWGGLGKSWLAMQLAMCVASGRAFLKEEFQIPKMKKVVFLNAEDDENEQHRRFRAIYDHMCSQYSEQNRPNESEGLKAKLEQRFHFIPVAGKGRISLGHENDEECQKAIIDEIGKLGEVGLVILDPANRLTDANFNSTEEITRFIQALDEIHHKTGATCLLVTHVNKASAEGRVTAGAVLGSNAFVNATRWVLVMASMMEAHTEKLGLSTEDARCYACIDIPKANYLPAGMVNKFWVKRTESGVLQSVYFTPDLEEELLFLDVLQSISEMPKTELIKTLTKETDFSKRKVRKELEKLIKGRIVSENKDTSKKGMSKICTVNEAKLQKYRSSLSGGPGN